VLVSEVSKKCLSLGLGLEKKVLISSRTRIQKSRSRLGLELQRLVYIPVVQYTPEKEMFIVDTLRRSFLFLSKEPPQRVEREIVEDTVISINTIIADAPVSNSRIDKIQEKCARDEEMQLLYKYLHNAFPQDNSTLSGNLRQYRALANELYEQESLFPLQC